MVMKIGLSNLFLIFSFCLLIGCNSSSRHLGDPVPKQGWHEVFSQKLPLLGHRNWVLVVDKAYPAPAGENMIVIDTEKPMAEVLGGVVGLINQQAHVRPIFYADKELQYLDENIAPGLKDYKTSLDTLFHHIKLQPLIHEDVFRKMDQAASLFQVIVLKTESLVPYSSVFIELDCKYWDAGREKILRERMANAKNY
ncbi:MAG: hypothetical protein K0R59_1034 [Sphingobacterium sp.]|jgi:D-ribose pyranose/furanose isomerase RbsD|nr:hypothetical protein [Sphingobacterium sp.]